MPQLQQQGTDGWYPRVRYTDNDEPGAPPAQHHYAGDNPAGLWLHSQTESNRSSMVKYINRFVGWLSGGVFNDYTEYPWHTITPARALFCAQEIKRCYNSNTAHTILSRYRAILHRCAIMGYLSWESYHQIRATVTVKGKVQRIPREVTYAELRAMYQVCNLRRPGGARDAAVLTLMASMGLRRAEISALNFDDYNQHRSFLTIKGKGGTIRELPVVSSPRAFLKTWLDHRGDEPGPFIYHTTRSARALVPRRLQNQAVRDVVYRLQVRAGIEEKFSCHDLRRTYITQLVREDVHINTIQHLAGHSSPDTTRAYDIRPSSELRAAQFRHHKKFGRHIRMSSYTKKTEA